MENGKVEDGSLIRNQKKKKAYTFFSVPDTVRIIRGPDFDTITPTSTPKTAFHINPFKVFPTQVR